MQFDFLDIFLLTFIYKVFIICLIFLAFFDYLDIYLKNNKFKKICLSVLFLLSFWSIYIFEIDALSQLTSIPIFLICIKNMNFFIKNLEHGKKNIIVFYIINISALFLIYPELFIIFLLIFGLYFRNNI